MTESRRHTNILFRASAVLAALFCVTVLALIAALGGGGGSPVAKFLNTHGTLIISVEVGVILICSIGAMTIDRWRTLRDQQKEDVALAEPTGSMDSDIPPS